MREYCRERPLAAAFFVALFWVVCQSERSKGEKKKGGALQVEPSQCPSSSSS